MNPELELLIRLQQLETAAEMARRAVSDEPVRQQQLDARLAAAQHVLDTERQRLEANKLARREIEKELAMHQGRLSKYKDQLMAVKTNREYQAMQKEMETAQREIQSFEDKMLERMIEFDDVTAEIKKTEKAFADQKVAIEQERRELAARVAEASASLTQIAAERATIAPTLPPAQLASFERILKNRGGQAVAEARDGRCTACQVRLRPQMYSELRRGDTMFHCDSCQRILFFVPPVVPGT
jgi:uncharacterized protein